MAKRLKSRVPLETLAESLQGHVIDQPQEYQPTGHGPASPKVSSFAQRIVSRMGRDAPAWDEA
jgi:hypothetical protein